ncbi:MAG: hypothetical protein ACE5RN_04370 [Nitrosopumilaceae archaeon]
MSTQGFTQKTIDVGDRKFFIYLLSFDNGNFVSISEGRQKIGSMVVSIGSGPTPTTATVIPAKTDSLFLKLTAEKISTSIRGIGVVSLFAERELGNETAKILMKEIMGMFQS